MFRESRCLEGKRNWRSFLIAGSGDVPGKPLPGREAELELVSDCWIRRCFGGLLTDRKRPFLHMVKKKPLSFKKTVIDESRMEGEYSRGQREKCRCTNLRRLTENCLEIK